MSSKNQSPGPLPILEGSKEVVQRFQQWFVMMAVLEENVTNFRRLVQNTGSIISAYSIDGQ